MRMSAFIVVIFVNLAAFVPTTAIDTLGATRLTVVLVTTSFAAIVTTLVAPVIVPDRVGHDIKRFNGGIRIVTLDDQLTAFRTLFLRTVPNQDTQTRARMQRRGEGVVDQLPVFALTLECNAGHMKLAVAYVADRDGALPEAAEVRGTVMILCKS